MDIQTVVCIQKSCTAVLNIFTMVIALLSFKVIWRTVVIHRNLKAVLLAQNATILGISLSSIVSTIYQFSIQNLFSVSPVLFSVSAFFAEFIILIGHVLFIERILATIFVRKYEYWTRPHFTIFWATILILICAFNDYMNLQGLNTKVFVNSSLPQTVVLNFLIVLVCFIEIFIMIRLRLYNASKYSMNEFYSRQKHTLSERYQLSENVRTIRQLGPVFVTHFVISLATFVEFAFQTFFPGASQVVLLTTLMLYSVILACSNLAILLFVIRFHPVLKNIANRVRRNLMLVLCPRRFNNQVHDAAVGIQTAVNNTDHPSVYAIQSPDYEMQPVVDQNIVTTKEGEFYFKMLSEQWS